MMIKFFETIQLFSKIFGGQLFSISSTFIESLGSPLQYDDSPNISDSWLPVAIGLEEFVFEPSIKKPISPNFSTGKD